MLSCASAGCAASASHQPPKKSRPPAQMPMRSPRKRSHAQVQSHLICLRIGAMRQQDLQMGHTGPRRRGCRRHARRHDPTTQPPGQSTTHTALPGHTPSCTHKHTPSISRVLVVSTPQKMRGMSSREPKEVPGACALCGAEVSWAGIWWLTLPKTEKTKKHENENVESLTACQCPVAVYHCTLSGPGAPTPNPLHKSSKH